MLYHWLADLIVVAHLTFVVFVLVGGFVALRWPWIAWLHVPAAGWGVLVEWSGRICPITPLEQHLRMRAGEAGYYGGFIDHYLLRTLYPAGLTRGVQWELGTLALLVNLIAYTLLATRGRRSPAA